MKNLLHELHEYFYFTRLERNASFTLFLLCSFFFLLPTIYPLIMPPKPEYDFSEYREAILAAMAESKAKKEMASATPKFRGEKKKPVPVELFKFDPNTATKEELIRLGISSRTANTLVNYRSKGGRFFKKEDMKKVYGFREEDYDRLEEWIIVNNKKPQKKWDRKERGFEKTKPSFAENESKKPPTGGVDKKPFYSKKEYTKKEYTPPIIDINKTIAEDWQKLRGIGPGYSKRIVNFRDKLGGFISVEQVGSTYNLPDSTFQKIKPYLTVSPVFRKIKINQLDLKGLKSHPYISSYQATILFNYRKQHGSFTDMDSLKKTKAGFKKEDWERLEGYLSFE